MKDTNHVATEARELMLKQYQGVLSTHSIDAPGYPFGSVTPYCFDRQGRPVILISRIAQHTKNIEANPKVSLLVTEGETDDVQAHGRVTYLGEARRNAPDDEDSAERYYRFFPEARSYHNTHDFDFYHITLYRVRFIGGFGKIHWVEQSEFACENPFSVDEENGAIAHMNEDHSAAIKHYCHTDKIPLAQNTTPVMVGIDSAGFHLRLAKRIYRIGFDEATTNMSALRSKLATMAR